MVAQSRKTLPDGNRLLCRLRITGARRSPVILESLESFHGFFVVVGAQLRITAALCPILKSVLCADTAVSYLESIEMRFFKCRARAENIGHFRTFGQRLGLPTRGWPEAQRGRTPLRGGWLHGFR